jgi:mono/diheme cytochrome c family protein
LKQNKGFSTISAWASLLALAALPSAWAETPASSPRALLDQYCAGCHNEKVKTAGVSVQGLDPANVSLAAGTWEKILRKVSAGQMPPAGLPRPQAAAALVFTKWLEQDLDKSAAAHPNPGMPTIHRLNRAEYSNAIRDLLALDIKPGSKLPADDTGYGFDNIGDVLSLSPLLIERYMSVGRMVSRLAVGDINRKPEVNEFEAPRLGRGARIERLGNDLPFDSAGGLSIQYPFPVDAVYVFKIKMPGVGTAEPKVFEERIPVKAGTRTVAVTFLADNAAPEVVAGFGFQNAAAQGTSGRMGGPALTAKMDLRLDGARLKLFDVPSPRFTNIAVAGPYEISGPGDSPSRQKIFVCRPSAAKDEESCAHKILSTLARRAYRRPVTDADLKPLLAFYQTGRREGSFDGGIEMALRAMLVSPNFLFRVERDPQGAAPGSVYRINDYELASRLSFFLWSSIPDDQLLQLADQGKLKDPGVLSAQVSRMLEDRRSSSFVSNFAGQWLFLRTLSQVKPDQDAFPKFDGTLRHAFERETEMFFEAVLRENRPVTDLLSADFTYLNQRLAEHYGIPNVYGSQFRRVALTDVNRGGLLAQGSILTVTSYPNRTSVVQRGKWVLENLLGTPPPPPPPDVPALEAHAKDGALLTMRQQMEQHRANSTCASCHSRMDPIGFALENYDGVGAFRTKDSGNAIDASGKMPDGHVFQGPSGLKDLLLTTYRKEFISTFTEKLMTYALGRGIEYYDQPALRAIIRDAATQNTSIPAIIDAIIKSPQFQTRRARET